MIQLSYWHYAHLAFITGVGTLVGLYHYSNNLLLLHSALLLSLGSIIYAALQDLWHKKIGSELFFVIATLVGIAANQEQAAVIIILVVLIAEFLAELVEARTEQALSKLLQLMPTQVLLWHDGIQQERKLSQIQIGDTIIVPTGWRIAVDGTVISGNALVNESALTGESIPVEKGVGSLVYAGTFIEAGSIIMQTEQLGKETLFGKITQLLAQAEEQKAQVVGIADKIAIIFSFAILALAAVTWFLTHDLTKVITLLVFGSPTELVLITPLAILAGIAASFKQGILIKGGIALEQLSQVNTFIVDKTGTLTTGNPVVHEVHTFNPTMTTQELITIAASLEYYGTHVLAQAVKRYAKEHQLATHIPTDYNSIAGHGIYATLNGIGYLVGNYHFLTSPEHGNLSIAPTQITTSVLPSFYVATEHKVLGVITIYDPIRPTAKTCISQLHAQGLQTITMLSGDRQEVAERICHEVGINQCLGNQFPEQKLLYIRQLQQKGNKVAMVGDGINDAPALKAADVGIAMGSMGMEPAIAAADIVLISNDLTKLPYLYALSRHVFATIRQNILFGLVGVHGFGIIAALYGLVTPVQASLIHGVADIVIVLNSARIIHFSYTDK